MKIYPSDYLAALASGAIDNATDEEKLLGLVKESERIVNDLVDAHVAEGTTAPPLHDLYLRESLLFVSMKPATEDRIRLARALQRNITTKVYEHHKYRHEANGNVVFEFSGTTGMGKSSCMLGLLERLNGVKPEDIEKHLTIDPVRIPDILPALGKGSGLAVDEQTHLVGEGSITAMKNMRNVEDQTRLTGVDIYWASPEKRDHETSQGEFQAFQVNREKHYTKFLVWINEIPLGYCSLQWASPDLWAAYEPIKAKNVDRAARALFNAPGAHDDLLRRIFAHDATQTLAKRRRLRKDDFTRLLRRFGPSLSSGQLMGLAIDAHEMTETLRNHPEDFRVFYGWDPTEAMERVAEGEDQEDDE